MKKAILLSLAVAGIVAFFASCSAGVGVGHRGHTHGVSAGVGSGGAAVGVH